jgi:hypothetical protein
MGLTELANLSQMASTQDARRKPKLQILSEFVEPTSIA